MPTDAPVAIERQLRVPFLDLCVQSQKLRGEIGPRIEAVLNKCNFILGDEVGEFEDAFAAYCGVKHCVGVASGTDALHLSCRAADVEPGDEVVLPANTFIATALGVIQARAKPVLVDVNERDFLMDPAQLAAAVGARTKAIVPVHLYGRMVEMTAITRVAAIHNLRIIEDAAQAHGSTRDGERAGAVGDLGCFSFYPGKNLGACGDAGAVTTDDLNLKTKLEALRNYGSPQKHFHPELGGNSRLDTMQATILSAKLKYLDEYNRRRHEVARQYDAMLVGVGDLVLPEIPSGHSHVFHLYVVRSEHRDELVQHLGAHGVGCGIHYPTPIHLHRALAFLGYREGDFPVAERLSRQVLSLPMFPEISDAQIEAVVRTVRAFF